MSDYLGKETYLRLLTQRGYLNWKVTFWIRKFTSVIIFGIYDPSDGSRDPGFENPYFWALDPEQIMFTIRLNRLKTKIGVYCVQIVSRIVLTLRLKWRLFIFFTAQCCSLAEIFAVLSMCWHFCIQRRVCWFVQRKAAVFLCLFKSAERRFSWI